MDTVDCALTAASLGLRVFPLEPLSVIPAVANWREAATIDREIVAAWFAARPGSNYGIVTGASSDLFVVELSGKAAGSWWRSRGFSIGMRVAVPVGDDQTHLYFRVGGMNVANGTPHAGIQIHGKDDFVPGPGSMLSTGTYAGDFYQLSPSNFDPSVDFDGGSWGAMLPLLEVAGLIPEAMSNGEKFLDYIIGRSDHERTAEPRAIRIRLLTEALRVGLNAQQSLSIAWASAAGRELHEASNGEAQLHDELAAAQRLVTLPIEDGTPFGGPRRVAILTQEERERVAATSWWGTRYVIWAAGEFPGSATLLHEHYRWVVLSRLFTGLGVVPKLRGVLSLDLCDVVLSGNASAVELAKEAMVSLLQAAVVETQPPIDISDATKRHVKAGTSFEGIPKAGGSGLRRLGADSFTEYIWAVDFFANDDLAFAEQRQQRSVPTPWRLVTDLEDAREKLRSSLGEAPMSIYMEHDALERHATFKAAVKVIGVKQPTLEPVLRGFADTVWKCATLAAMSDGSPTVKLGHELAALEQAETWLANAMWLNEQAESAASLGLVA